MIGLSLESVVKMDCLFKDINDLNYLPEVLKDRFAGIKISFCRLRREKCD